MAAKRLFFLVFLVTFSAALGFPDPQEAATGGGGGGLNKDGGTDKCNAVQFQVLKSFPRGAAVFPLSLFFRNGLRMWMPASQPLSKSSRSSSLL